MERKVRDSCGKSVSRGDPAGASRGGSPTARGKRVPGVEINAQISQPLKKKIKDIQIFFKITDRGEHSDPLLSSTEKRHSTSWF
ncbi:hypothetical protein ACIP97_04170 [Peribacillus frigoritolerans]|uniref:hypothetical protein n=1 Tax=Peribacillus frigoritolerans TaxID=450367 RepID=UPI0038149CA2